jgi:hypothetical protein
MRKFIIGLIIGLVLGTVLTALAVPRYEATSTDIAPVVAYGKDSTGAIYSVQVTTAGEMMMQ